MSVGQPQVPAADRTGRLLLAAAIGSALVVIVVVGFSASPGGTAVLVVAMSLLAVSLVAISRRAAAARADLKLQVERQAERLSLWAAAQTRFVDRIAHEIRTPLTIVGNHAELVLRGSDDPVAVRLHARSIIDYTRYFADLCEGFLRLAEPVVAPDPGHHVPVHVHDLVVDAVRRCQALARGRGVVVVVTFAPAAGDEPSPEVLGNEALLRAMFESVVRHAVNASWRGARVAVQVLAEHERVLLRVRHHGAPIEPAELESVFDWFTAVGPAGSRDGGGLAISRRIVEHHRGTIALHNHAEGGCEFVITLPRWRGEQGPAAGAEATGRTPTIAGLARAPCR